MKIISIVENFDHLIKLQKTITITIIIIAIILFFLTKSFLIGILFIASGIFYIIFPKYNYQLQEYNKFKKFKTITRINKDGTIKFKKELEMSYGELIIEVYKNGNEVIFVPTFVSHYTNFTMKKFNIYDYDTTGFILFNPKNTSNLKGIISMKGFYITDTEYEGIFITRLPSQYTTKDTPDTIPVVNGLKVVGLYTVDLLYDGTFIVNKTEGTDPYTIILSHPEYMIEITSTNEPLILQTHFKDDLLIITNPEIFPKKILKHLTDGYKPTVKGEGTVIVRVVQVHHTGVLESEPKIIEFKKLK